MVERDKQRDNSLTRGKLSKSWGVCQVIDAATLATTIRTQGIAIHREDHYDGQETTKP